MLSLLFPEVDSTDSDYTSDNMENDNSDSDSDKTFILPENQEVSDIDSHKTVSPEKERALHGCGCS